MYEQPQRLDVPDATPAHVVFPPRLTVSLRRTSPLFVFVSITIELKDLAGDDGVTRSGRQWARRPSGSQKVSVRREAGLVADVVTVFGTLSSWLSPNFAFT